MKYLLPILLLLVPSTTYAQCANGRCNRVQVYHTVPTVQHAEVTVTNDAVATSTYSPTGYGNYRTVNRVHTYSGPPRRFPVIRAVCRVLRRL